MHGRDSRQRHWTGTSLRVSTSLTESHTPRFGCSSPVGWNLDWVVPHRGTDSVWRHVKWPPRGCDDGVDIRTGRVIHSELVMSASWSLRRQRPNRRAEWPPGPGLFDSISDSRASTAWSSLIRPRAGVAFTAARCWQPGAGQELCPERQNLGLRDAPTRASVTPLTPTPLPRRSVDLEVRSAARMAHHPGRCRRPTSQGT